MQPTDPRYIAAKAVKQGKASMPARFQPIADFIFQQWQLKPLYIDLRPATAPNGTSILDVIMMNWEECRFFLDNSAHQQLIIAALQAIDPQPKVYVNFDAFRSAALSELMERVPGGAISGLAPSLDPGLWKVATFYSSITFFMYTEEQKKQRQGDGSLDRWLAVIAPIIRQYDTEDIFALDGIYAQIDSKENFDTNYSGNWYYYYK